VIICAAAAQVAPVCCKYIGNWPSEGNPSGECAGSSSKVCYTGAVDATLTDPLAYKYSATLQPAACVTITLSGSAYFVHQPCNWPPPSGYVVWFQVRLSDDQCCYIVGDFEDLTFTWEDLEYQIPTCTGDCASGPPE